MAKTAVATVEHKLFLTKYINNDGRIAAVVTHVIYDTRNKI